MQKLRGKTVLTSVTLLVSALVALSPAAAAAPASEEQLSGSEDFVIAGHYVRVEYVMDIKTIVYFDKSGVPVRIFKHIVEQDTFSNEDGSKALITEPYRVNLQFVRDRNGDVHVYGSGEAVRVRLPDGSTFSCAGRNDFVLDPGEDNILVPGWENLDRLMFHLLPYIEE